MKISRIDPLLNDPEINYLADIFLAACGFDRTVRGYRLFRNAIVLFSHGLFPPDKAFKLLAECADMPYDEYIKELETVLDDLPEPVHIAFNSAFVPEPNPFARSSDHITMDDNSDPKYIVTFLGTVFLYIVVTNYQKYGYVSFDGAAE